MATSDDRDIVRAVLAGRTDQFATLVRRYHRPLIHLAENRLGHLDLAEDAVQDTFLAAYRSLSTYKFEFNFRTWLWTILLNQCRRYQSKLARLPSQSRTWDEGELGCQGQHGDTPDISAMRTERDGLLRELMAQLPEAQADAIRLRFFGCLKYREIADVMQSSLSSAKQRVRLGLLALSKMLHDRELIDVLFPGDS